MGIAGLLKMGQAYWDAFERQKARASQPSSTAIRRKNCHEQIHRAANRSLSATLVLLPIPALPQEPPIDRALARQYFAEAKSISDKDNGALWTVPCADRFSSSIPTLATPLRIKPISRAGSNPWMASSREKRQTLLESQTPP